MSQTMRTIEMRQHTGLGVAAHGRNWWGSTLSSKDDQTVDFDYEGVLAILRTLESLVEAAVTCRYYGRIGWIPSRPAKVSASTYSVRASVAVSDPTCTLCDQTNINLTLESGYRPSIGEASAALQENISRLSIYAGAPVNSEKLIVDELSPGAFRGWKALALGGALGLLLAIGFAYVWDDARAYRRRLEARA